MKESNLYPRGRKIFYKNEYVLILPENYKESIEKMPLFCDVCKIVFSNHEDEKTYKIFKCCSLCADTWAYSHKDEWINGWRPDQSQIDSAVRKRLFVDSNIVFE
jgi:hypothetical protein